MRSWLISVSWEGFEQVSECEISTKQFLKQSESADLETFVYHLQKKYIKKYNKN